MSKYEVSEQRAMKGAGGGIYKLDETDGKYAALIATTKLPFIASSISDIDIKVVNSSIISKIDGVETLETSETEVYMHRDAINKLEEINGKLLHLMSVAPDFTGYKYDASITYTPNEVEMDAAWMGTIKITPKNKPQYVENCFSLLKPTIKYVDAVSPTITLETTTGTAKQLITTDPKDATLEVKSDSDAIATVKNESGTVTITGVKEGSTIVRYKATKEGYAPAQTTTLVIVPKAGEQMLILSEELTKSKTTK